jgi:transposase
MAQVEVKVKLDMPPGVEVLGYERCGEGHGFEVKFPLPLYCRCEKCGVKEPAKYEGKGTVYAVRDLDLWGQPSFLIFQPYFHRCSRCGHRQEHFAPFKRKKVMYTYRFEEYVLRMLIGSNEEEVAQRLGISAETVPWKRTAWTWASTDRCAPLCCPTAGWSWTGFTWPSSSTTWWMTCGKKNTRKYKAGLSKAQQERFRSLMWEFRRDPKDLKPEEREALDRLFAELPVLKDVYDVRVRFKEIFDTAPDVTTAESQLAELRQHTEALGLNFSKFWTTYDNWKTGILNYFDGRYTSAAVEGINNKARVITKRCYGVKSSDTLWNRLILDLNRASEAVGRNIAELREITSGLKDVFLAFCT